VAIYTGMLGISELMEDEGFSTWVLDQSDETLRQSPQALWDTYQSQQSVSPELLGLIHQIIGE